MVASVAGWALRQTQPPFLCPVSKNPTSRWSKCETWLNSPLGSMNVFPKVQGNLSNSCQDISVCTNMADWNKDHPNHPYSQRLVSPVSSIFHYVCVVKLLSEGSIFVSCRIDLSWVNTATSSPNNRHSTSHWRTITLPRDVESGCVKSHQTRVSILWHIVHQPAASGHKD